MTTKANIRIIATPEKEKREKGTESVFKEIIAENFPNHGKELDIQVHKADRTLLSQCKKIFSKTPYNEIVKNHDQES